MAEKCNDGFCGNTRSKSDVVPWAVRHAYARLVMLVCALGMPPTARRAAYLMTRPQRMVAALLAMLMLPTFGAGAIEQPALNDSAGPLVLIGCRQEHEHATA